MAEGYLRYFAKDKADVYSAGIEVHGLNQIAVSVMKEDGINISNQTSDHVNEYAGMDFDFVITVCNNAKERCPFFSSSAKMFHQNFPDPAIAAGSEDEIANEFRRVRNRIRQYCRTFAEENILAIDPIKY
jgi:arsenate reductase